MAVQMSFPFVLRLLLSAAMNASVVI
jgi:hypothetical protein